VDYARSGDTIWICEGTYYERVRVYKSLKIKGWTDDCRKVVIKPRFSGPDQAEPVAETEGFFCRDGIYVEGVDFVVIKDLTVEGFCGNGIAVRFANDVELEDVCAIDNGEDGVGVRYVGLTTMCEVHAYDNGDDGIDVMDGGGVELCETWSKYNDEDGIDIERVGYATVKDSVVCYNDDQGIDIDYIGGDGGCVSDKGCEESEYGLVELKRVWAEKNYDDGLNIQCAGDVVIKDGNYNKNEDDGIRLAGVDDVFIENINATCNADDGLDMDGTLACLAPAADHVFIDYAEFSYNGGEGIDMELVNEVKIEEVSANGNGADGMSVILANLLDVYYAEFSENGDDGIDTDCVKTIVLDDVWAKENYDDGLVVNVVFSEQSTETICFSDVFIFYSKMNKNGRVGIRLRRIGELKIVRTETERNGDTGIIAPK
jgi:hypothetical protein